MALVAVHAPTVGVLPLCVALGVSRATAYRRNARSTRAVSTVGESTPNVAQKAPNGALAPSGERPGVLDTLADGALAVGRCGKDATAPTLPLAEAADAGSARNGPDLAAVAATPPPDRAAEVSTRSSPRALSPADRAAVLATLTENRFCDLAPAEVYATLLDEGRYLCSERTMYRILDANHAVRERRNQLRHPTYVAPELMATKPNQLWSWDITKLKTFVKCQYFHLYVLLDVFSRYVVGWLVSDCESGDYAKLLIEETCRRQGIQPGTLTLHADNGSAMVSQPVACLLDKLGATKTHSRPHVSDDNPYSEAQFKTLKYRPDFPERFASLDHARTFNREFFDWYNTKHHHDGLALLTPYDVHHGLVAERLAARARVLRAAYEAHPERFVHGPPSPREPPKVVWINPPKEPVTMESVQA